MPNHNHGVRQYSDYVGRFLCPDGLWAKYVGWTPYQYAGNNPINFFDKNGLIVNISNFLNNASKEAGSGFLGDLSTITGLDLYYNGGFLQYKKDSKGNPIISDKVNSKTARDILLNLINNPETLNVNYSTFGCIGNDCDIDLCPSQINNLTFSDDLDKRTMGLGMAFFHEYNHTDFGGDLIHDINAPFPHIDQTLRNDNKIRAEMGPKWGQQLSYPGQNIGIDSYIPFSKDASRVLQHNPPQIPEKSYIQGDKQIKWWK